MILNAETRYTSHCVTLTINEKSPICVMAREPSIVPRTPCRWGFRDHIQTHHTQQDFSGRVISPTLRPLPDNTQHSQETDIHTTARASNPHFQKARGRRPTLWTARSLELSCRLIVMYSTSHSFCERIININGWTKKFRALIVFLDLNISNFPYVELVYKTDDCATIVEVYFSFQSIVLRFLVFRWSVFSILRTVMHCSFYCTSLGWDTVIALSSFTFHMTFKANGGPLGYPLRRAG